MSMRKAYRSVHVQQRSQGVGGIAAVCRLILIILMLIIAPASMPLQQADAQSSPAFETGWIAPVNEITTSVAWGDYDGDGDLDLAVGNSGEPNASKNGFLGQKNRLYRNKGDGTFESAWQSSEEDPTLSVAWGDIDGDGDLDLAVGNNGAPNRIYVNRHGTLDQQGWPLPTANPSQINLTTSVAWGDYDGDGDLDLAVGNGGYNLNLGISGLIAQRNLLYRNNGTTADGTPMFTLAWTAPDPDPTTSVAWGDIDGDGDLDLLFGNIGYHPPDSTITIGSPSRLYRNNGGTLTPDTSWTPELHVTFSVALGDVDGDGDLDLAIGNASAKISDGFGGIVNIVEANQLYRNQGGVLTLDPWRPESNTTLGVAWGDYDGDGDLDLAAGNSGAAGSDEAGAENQLYLNQSGVLTTTARIWSEDAENTFAIAWGDYDNDGDLDIVAGNGGTLLETGTAGQITRVYRNPLGRLPIASAWSSAAEHDRTSSVAWGDYDSDGDLDLAVGNLDPNQPDRLYRNDGVSSDGSTPLLVPVPFLSANDRTLSVAWGDYDSDGDLDLVVGNDGQPNRLYHNDRGTLVLDTNWSPPATATNSVAWGDIDGDGDLDLAVGNDGAANQLYRNIGGVLTLDSAWHPVARATRSVAWGDVDGDGDLDLAVGNAAPQTERTVPQPNQLYRNDRGTLEQVPVWESEERDLTSSVAWGDYDGDGHLDLAAGNDGQPNRLYHNDRGTLTRQAAWSSNEADLTTSVAWGDYDGDGDLDLAAGNGGFFYQTIPTGQRNRLYRNDGGTLTRQAAWSSAETEITLSVAWGDVDGDGDLDLAAGNVAAEEPNRVYRNTRDARSSPAAIPTVRITRPGRTPGADFYSTAEVLAGPTIPFSYTLAHPRSLPVGAIRGEYSLDGGGNWNNATPTTNTLTTTLSTSPTGTLHSYTWDMLKDGVFGLNDNVIFRLVALPDLRPSPNQTPAPYQYSAYAANTFPFRVRGNQVRVLKTDGTAAEGALVYRLTTNQSESGDPYDDDSHTPFLTDKQGFLQGRGEVLQGDELVAALPISATDSYTIYLTSAAPSTTGLDTYRVRGTGVQTLTISADNPLILFNLTVSLEWDARYDERFMTRLQSDLQRTSELLYDWANGQVALGQITVYHNRQSWNTADVRVYASNRIRPNAYQGGIVTSAITDPVSLQATDPITPAIVYTPGRINIGAVWNRFGDSGNNLSEDWPRALAHEIGHYALFLNDNYLGLKQNLIVPVISCPGAMTNPYRDDYSEFHPSPDWQAACGQTLAGLTTRRSDWQTMTTFYKDLREPATTFADTNPGPTSLPLRVTHIKVVELEQPVNALDVPIFYLRDANNRRYTQPSASARAFLFQGDHLIDLGRPVADQVLARGAQLGDRLCLYDLENEQQGCETVQLGRVDLQLQPSPRWQPEVRVMPITSSTLTISVTTSRTITQPMARIFPLDSSPSVTITLSAATEGGPYSGTFDLGIPAPQGHVQIWAIDEIGKRREIVTDYALGGSPAFRSGSGVPTISPDGQVTLYGLDQFKPGEFYTFQSAANIPQAPSWATVVGQAYRISKSARAPSLNQRSISFSYLGSEVPPGEEDGLRVYFWDGDQWNELPTTLDPEFNIASASTPGEGLYALMSSIQVPLYNAGWNLFAYPVRASRPVTEALSYIGGRSGQRPKYTTVYGYVGANTPDPWQVYDVDAPDWVNDLKNLEYGRGYWIYATEPITILLKGGWSSLPPQAANYLANGIPDPPATYYGEVRAFAGVTPAENQLVEARINTTACGQTRTQLIDTRIVYAISIPADDGQLTVGCGVPGRTVEFFVESHRAPNTALWNNNRVQRVDLGDVSP